MSEVSYRIDALQYANWSEKIFKQMRTGKLDAVHVTIAYHENFRETVANIEQWNSYFERFPHLIFQGSTGDDVRLARDTNRSAIFFGFQNPSPRGFSRDTSSPGSRGTACRPIVACGCAIQKFSTFHNHGRRRLPQCLMSKNPNNIPPRCAKFATPLFTPLKPIDSSNNPSMMTKYFAFIGMGGNINIIIRLGNAIP